MSTHNKKRKEKKMGNKKNNNMDGGAFPLPLPLPLPLPPLLRDLLASLLNNNSFIYFVRKYKLLQTLRFILLNSFIFLLRFLPSFLFLDKYDAVKVKQHHQQLYKYTSAAPPYAPRNDTAIGRALSQLLSALNDIPVSSRKYQVVRSLAESIIDDNHQGGVHALREVNRGVMSAAFVRTMKQLEATVGEEDGECYGVRLRRVVKAVGGWRVRVIGGGGGEGNLSGVPAEKLAAELLWLAQKMAACGCADEAIQRWSAASNLGFLALSADPRLQTTLVKLAGKINYLIKFFFVMILIIM